MTWENILGGLREGAEPLFAVATLAVAIWAAMAAIDQLKEARRQRKVQIGLQYLDRYWSISDDLLHATKGSHEHKQHQHRYLILCEDEYDAAREQWLEEGMWRQWHEWLASEVTRELTQRDLTNCADSVHEFRSVRACLTGAAGHDWAKCPANPSFKFHL